MSQTTTLPAKTIDLLILDHKFTVSFPNTGQFIDMQALKGRIASDNYNQLANSTDQYTGYAMLLTDMIATFNVLIPELKAKMNVSSILGLDMIDSAVLLGIYIKEWLPFFNGWMDIITAAKVKEDEPTKAD